MLECRGMSNVAGDRNRTHWRLREALDHCHGVLRTWLARCAEKAGSP
jgi:futalosine hydrolase